MSKIKFNSFAVMQSGQKSNTVNAEPQLIANTTLGKFVITAPVSKALNIAVGENVMFLNNIADVEKAIAERNPELVNWANENGVNLDSNEGKETAMQEFVMYCIAKGIPQYNAKGEPIMADLRFTKEEKLEAAIDNMETIMGSETMYAKIAEVMENPEVTVQEVCDVLRSEESNDFIDGVKSLIIDCVKVPQYHVASGSRTATTGKAKGVGCQLSFSDTAIWNTLKHNLGKEKELKNRVFNVELNEGFKANAHDGQKVVEFMCYPLTFLNDTDPIVRNKAE